MHAGCKVSSFPSLTPFDLLVVNVLSEDLSFEILVFLTPAQRPPIS